MQDTAQPSEADVTLRADFLQAMRRLTATVTIVTKAHEGGAIGMTATAVCSLTTDPPAVLACINRCASICQWLVPGEPFCVNLLASTHAAIASEFAGRSPVEQRFDHGRWERDENGPPFLHDALCNLFCEVDLATIYGTHTILVGRVFGVRLPETTEPLLYGNGGFRTAAGSIHH